MTRGGAGGPRTTSRGALADQGAAGTARHLAALTAPLTESEHTRLRTLAAKLLNAAPGGGAG